MDIASKPPKWVELLPAGEFRGKDGRGPFFNRAPRQVIAATLALGMNAGLPIDLDHATDFAAPQGRPAPAVGWIREFQIRNGAIWGRVEWNAAGAKAIQQKEYRYLSPVFQFAPPDGDVTAQTGPVTRILRASLTNNPNLNLAAIANAAAMRRGVCVASAREIITAMKGTLTAAEQKICMNMGISEHDFITRRDGHPAGPETAAVLKMPFAVSMSRRRTGIGDGHSVIAEHVKSIEDNKEVDQNAPAKNLVAQAQAALADFQKNPEAADGWKILGRAGALITKALDGIHPTFIDRQESYQKDARRAARAGVGRGAPNPRAR
jgi:hypothetical protein